MEQGKWRKLLRIAPHRQQKPNSVEYVQLRVVDLFNRMKQIANHLFVDMEHDRPLLRSVAIRDGAIVLRT